MSDVCTGINACIYLESFLRDALAIFFKLDTVTSFLGTNSPPWLHIKTISTLKGTQFPSGNLNNIFSMAANHEIGQFWPDLNFDSMRGNLAKQ